jgi:hypothetical protein
VIKLSLPFWQTGKSTFELIKLATAAQRFYEKLQRWLSWPLNQLDPLDCTLPILELLAWQRDIVRFENEPLALYRKRVAFAYVNAKDAGSTAGMRRIFERLGVGYVELAERTDPINWDVITVRLSDNQLSGNQTLIELLLRYYGRTCRRYTVEILNPVVVELFIQPFQHDHETHTASL